RSIGIFEKTPQHPDLGATLHNLAKLYKKQGRYSAAQPLYVRSLDIFEKALGPDHPNVSTVLHGLAELAYLRSDWSRAADYCRRSIDIIKRRDERGLAGNSGKVSAGEAQRLAPRFWGLIKAAHHIKASGLSATAALEAEMFETAQWAQGSEAAASLAQMAARSATGQLPELVRERQDLASEWQAKEERLIAAKSEPPVKRKADAEMALAERLAAIDARLSHIDRRLAQEFPDYTLLTKTA